MIKDWKQKGLGDLCSLVRGPFGGSLKKSCFKPDGYAVYEQQHAIYNKFDNIRYFIDKSKFTEMQRFELLPGDLIMSCSGTMGKVAIVPENIPQGIINQALLKLSPGKDVLAQFLGYWMNSPTFQKKLNQLSQGVAIKNVASVKVLKEIKIDLPTLPEQKQIVAILDEAFEGIDAAIANTEKNLANAREMLESYLNGVFTQKGKGGDVGMKGWEQKGLGDLCSLVRGPFGGSLKKSCFKPDGYAVYEQQHAIYNKFDNIRYFIDESKFMEMQRFELLPGDLIMSCSGTMGKVAIVPEDISQGIINQALLKLSPGKDVVAQFLGYWMNSPTFQKKLNQLSQGVAIKNVASVKVLKDLKIDLPPLPEQKQIVAVLDKLQAETQRLESIYQRKLEALKELKQSILEKAFTGELTSDTAKEVADTSKEIAA